MSTRDIVFIALFAALMAVLGLFPALTVPVINVPVTAQSMGVMLAGGILGARRGTLAILLFILIALAGLPLLAGGRGGLAVLAGPTVGFLLGWLPAAFAIGWIVESRAGRLSVLSALLANVVGGIVVLYACGIVGVSIVAGIPLLQAATASAAFVPGDLVKAVVAALVTANVARIYPLTPASRAPRETAA